MTRPSTSAYPRLRRILAPEYRYIADGEVEQIVGRALGGAGAEDVENLLQQAGSVLKRALPGVVQGAAQGAMVGGPWGALLGGLGGGVASAVTGGKARAPAPPPGAGAAPAAPAVPAAGQLLTAVPELVQALVAMMLGRYGARGLDVAGTSVPPAAFANLASVLGTQVAAQQNAAMSPNAAEGVPEYLLDQEGELLVDPASPVERAARLMTLVTESVLLMRPKTLAVSGEVRDKDDNLAIPANTKLQIDSGDSMSLLLPLLLMGGMGGGNGQGQDSMMMTLVLAMAMDK